MALSMEVRNFQNVEESAESVQQMLMCEQGVQCNFSASICWHWQLGNQLAWRNLSVHNVFSLNFRPWRPLSPGWSCSTSIMATLAAASGHLTAVLGTPSRCMKPLLLQWGAGPPAAGYGSLS
jgi:hypothetical protein